MPENTTANCALPLLMPAQAQKHVTVNDALMRLDGQVDLVLQSLTRSTPPEAVADGLCWGVPAGAVNAWEGQAGKIAIAANGGWVFVQPGFGRRAMIADQGATALHDGLVWVVGAVTLGEHGSGMIARQMSEDVTLGRGTGFQTVMAIPSSALVIGATARVLSTITGGAASWTMGTEGALNRFGQGLGKEQGSWARGILSAPMTYWEPAPVILTATGGQFTGGQVRVVVHWWELRVPN
ncbi:Protein of unknown function [Paracoccus halophilus]|uniref:DUF2793 domain-containing protein n=1 Tax=Paracoccus halophilus TaxID=376733 RepID=A0A099F300_9RHOB|nr:DUF2793 domain-containing protein [Paracoccus halophilus]KGJ04824.1 hypothetical protein IT41_09190 [Paracoccus halophilus]SFA51384.1 Protein of unknown function [Paracoccus halophilus]